MSRLLLHPIGGLCDMLGRAAVSPTMRAHDRKMAMQQENPVLAALLRIEAIGDARIENDQTADAQLATCRRLAREAVESITGKPFENPLYPLRGSR